MRLEAALQGDLNDLLKAELRVAEKAVTVGVREATDGLKTDLRRQITSAGLGSRLANTWRGEVYPKGQPSIGAAGFVWSKAPGLVRMYAEEQPGRPDAVLDAAGAPARHHRRRRL